jgi:hypothetical protein
MNREDIDEALAEENQARLESLREAYEALSQARLQLRHAKRVLAPGAEDVINLIVNGVEPIMWRVETEIRERKAR